MLPPDVTGLATEILDVLERQGLRLAVAESCTGGLVAAALTAIAGSSAVVDRGFVTYSNQAKAEMLGVPMPLIDAKGAVSREVAVAMAEGALRNSAADISVAITGIAGPGGGSADKPVGTVHFARAARGAATLHLHRVFDGNRDEVRRQATLTALRLFAPPPPI